MKEDCLKLTTYFGERDRTADGHLPQQLRDEIAHFFSVYKQPDGHDVTVEGWCPCEDALAIIEASRHRHRDRRA